MKELVERIDKRLEALGLTAAVASRLAGLSPDAIRNIRRAAKSGENRVGVSTNTLMALAKVLQTTVDELLADDADSPGAPLARLPAARIPARKSRRSEVLGTGLRVPDSLVRDLPVIGGAAAAAIPVGMPKGARDPILLNPTKPIDEIGRPVVLIGAPDAYAVWVIGDSMSPIHPAGEPRVVHPHRPVRAGDAVIIQVREREGGPLFGFIKTFVGRSDQFVIARQLNPEAVIRFKASTVVAVHRVLTYGELLGVSR